MNSLLGIRIETADIIVIAIYFILIVGIGLWSGIKRRGNQKSSDYFLAGGSLTWPLIGLALFSTNISTIHMVGFAEEGYVNGLAHGNFEWMAPFLLIVLALFFAPFYLRSRVTTLPDFLEQRYCGNCRNWLAFLSIISAIFIHICFSLYTGAVVIKSIFGINIWISIIAIALLTGLYTIIGGLLAVVLTSALQTVILLAGSIVITLVALHKVGGWEGLVANVDPVKLTVLRGPDDAANLPWLSVLLGYPVIGLWYWCADQTIVQRVLGAKDENHARVGPLFAGFLKVLPVFIFFLPGTVYLALTRQGVFEPLSDTKECYASAIMNLLPPGWTGLMAAALLAALMSTVSGALNSIATLFSYDLYKRWKPQTPDRRLIFIGQLATAIAMAVAVVCTRYVEKFPTLYQGANAVICYLAPPITTVFALGVFWKKASSRAALSTLVSGSLMGLMVFLLDINRDYTGWKIPFMYSAFYLLVLCVINMVILSLVYPHEHTAQSIKLVWKNPIESLHFQGWSGLGNYKLLAALLFAVMIFLYVVFANESTLSFFHLIK
ncbi:MAG TPA: sodium/solute symporter [Anaerohalosphaeraceae bacterium]|nr:sodium/solute symporter [Anaerohalosphaeraceae bacterium]